MQTWTIQQYKLESAGVSLLTGSGPRKMAKGLHRVSATCRIGIDERTSRLGSDRTPQSRPYTQAALQPVSQTTSIGNCYPPDLVWRIQGCRHRLVLWLQTRSGKPGPLPGLPALSGNECRTGRDARTGETGTLAFNLGILAGKETAGQRDRLTPSGSAGRGRHPGADPRPH